MRPRSTFVFLLLAAAIGGAPSSVFAAPPPDVIPLGRASTGVLVEPIMTGTAANPRRSSCADDGDDDTLSVCAPDADVVQALDMHATPAAAEDEKTRKRPQYTRTATGSRVHQHTRTSGDPPLATDEPTDGGENDFVSPAVPLSDAHRRARTLGVIAAIVLSAGFLYLLYTHYERVHAFLVALPLPHAFTQAITTLAATTKALYTPLLAFLPTNSASSRRRRRQLALMRFQARQSAKSGKGFRPAPDALRAWAVEAGSPLGAAYERGLGLLGSNSSSGAGAWGPKSSNGTGLGPSDYDAAYDGDDDDALDLGADEDFMIGAPSSSDARRGIAPPPRGGLVFSVGDDLDDAGFATDEELPLAPSPHQYAGTGAGAVRGYGTTG